MKEPWVVFYYEGRELASSSPGDVPRRAGGHGGAVGRRKKYPAGEYPVGG